MSRKSAQRRQNRQAQAPNTATKPTAPAAKSALRDWSLRKKLGIGIASALVAVALVLWGIYAIATVPLYQATQSTIVFHEDSAVKMQANGTAVYDGQTYTPRKNLYNILFIGIDRSTERVESGYASEELSLADTLILASIDLNTAEISFLSIPRDTMTTIFTHTREGEHNGYLTGQIATQYAYGGDSDDLRNQHMVESVSRLLSGLTINAYVTVDMDDIITVTDALDGVPVTVPADPYYCAYTGYTPGQWVMLDGEGGLQFVQYRDTAIFASCEMRVERQKVFLDGAVNRLYKAFKTSPFETIDLVEELYTLIDTSLPFDDCLLLAPKLVFFDMKSLSVETVPGQVMATELYEEYYCDADALDLLLLSLYYKER